MPSGSRSPLRRFRTSRLGSVVLAGVLTGISAHAQSAPGGPALSPQPREVRNATFHPARTVQIICGSGDTDDLFTAQDLGKTLSDRGLSVAPNVGPADLIIRLLRADEPAAKAALTSARLALDTPMHDEGYVLTPQGNDLLIIAPTSAGLFYGAQTVKQMLDTHAGVPGLWLATVRDWPAMKYRAVQDDLSRGPFPTLAYQKHQLDILAEHKVNLYSPYFEHTLAYSADPLAAPPGSSLSRAEAQELNAYARRRHITVIPEQEAFGHLHHRLIYEKYADLAESPHGHVLAPGQTASLPLIKTWFTQIAEDFPSPFLHVGADETFELGTGRTRADVEKRGLGPVYADFLSTIHTTLGPLNRRLLFWGDVAESDPSAVPRLPKDMIAIPWIYWHKDNYDVDILPFKNAGLETWVAPGDANWRVVYPLGKTALDNISGFVESGQRLGSTGELLAVWNDDGEGLFNQDWFGVLFGAAAAWQPGRSNGDAYKLTFGRSFFGDTTGKLDEAQRELMLAEDNIDVSDDAFWLDPWSSAGQAFNTRWHATIPAARLHAERAIELLQQLRQTDTGLREPEALAAMELGARRIDFIGLKFQLSDEMATAYSKAYAMRDDRPHANQAREFLYSISSMNGRCQDLRDGYSMLKNLYRDSWLAENRPFWLDNVLVRYDLRIQQWQKRGEDIDTLINNYGKTHTLPTAQEVGLPPTP